MNNFVLKCFALLFMLIDHIGYFFIRTEAYYGFRIIGRLAMPIFLFLFVEGFLKTKNRDKHRKELFVFGIIFLVGNLFLKILEFELYPLNTNIILTMYFCFLLLSVIESKLNNTYKILLCGLLCIIIYFCEYGMFAISLTIIFYLYLKNNLSKSILIFEYTNISLLICILENNFLQLGMLDSLPFLLAYNKQLGFKTKYSKYFFYVFYILHLWIFVIISNLKA